MRQQAQSAQFRMQQGLANYDRSRAFRLISSMEGQSHFVDGEDKEAVKRALKGKGKEGRELVPISSAVPD
jgi:hypothetical protein